MHSSTLQVLEVLVWHCTSVRRALLSSLAGTLWAFLIDPSIEAPIDYEVSEIEP
jgi:hypothetical protein